MDDFAPAPPPDPPPPPTPPGPAPQPASPPPPPTYTVGNGGSDAGRPQQELRIQALERRLQQLLIEQGQLRDQLQRQTTLGKELTRELNEARRNSENAAAVADRTFRQLGARVEDLDGGDENRDILQRVLLANVSADGTFSELTIVDGAVVSFADGRTCTSSGDPCKVIDLTGDQAVLIEVKDPPDHRYVRIRGGGGSILKITGDTSYSTLGPLPGGMYTASVVPLGEIIDTTVSEWGDEVVGDPGTSSAVYFLNLIEKGQVTHDLTTNTDNHATLALAIAIGTSDDGYPVYAGPLIYPGCDEE